MKQKKPRQSQGKRDKKRRFSLLEITLSLSILGIIASFFSWQMRDLFLGHQLQEGLKTLLIDIRQMQSLALSHRTDFEITFQYDPSKKEWFYTCTTDEPIPYYRHQHRSILHGVNSISLSKETMGPFSFSIYSSGRICPEEKVCFKGKKQQFELDLTDSPQIKLKDKLMG